MCMRGKDLQLGFRTDPKSLQRNAKIVNFIKCSSTQAIALKNILELYKRLVFAHVHTRISFKTTRLGRPKKSDT